MHTVRRSLDRPSLVHALRRATERRPQHDRGTPTKMRMLCGLKNTASALHGRWQLLVAVTHTV